MAERDWFADVRRQGVARVAAAHGLEAAQHGASRSCPCPACGQAKRHTKTKDKRGAVGLSADGLGWTCFQCEAKGDAVTFAAWVVVGKGKPSAEEWAGVRRWSAAHGLCEADPRDAQPLPIVRPYAPPPATEARATEPRRPPAGEVLALWGASSTPSKATLSADPSERAAALYVAGRGVNLGDLAQFEPELCRILPAPGAYAFPKWWPSSWAARWRWAVLAYGPTGQAESIHARAVVAELGPGEPKTRWPMGCEARGLFFANAAGVRMLRGDVEGVRGVVITEGVSSTVATAVGFAVDGTGYAVLGVTSGAPMALRAVTFPAVPVFVATDNDEQGDKYADEIRGALPSGLDVRRVRLGKVTT